MVVVLVLTVVLAVAVAYLFRSFCFVLSLVVNCLSRWQFSLILYDTLFDIDLDIRQRSASSDTGPQIPNPIIQSDILWF